MHVVVVEDEPDALASIIAYLTLCGVRVFGAATAEECLALCSRNRVDAVVTDINLPGMTGADLVFELRRLPQPPLIYGMSGGEPSSAIRRRFHHFFPKPLDLMHLEELLLGDPPTTANS